VRRRRPFYDDEMRHIRSTTCAFKLRWGRQSAICDPERELRAPPSLASVFLFLSRSLSYETDVIKGVRIWRRFALTVAQRLELALQVKLKDYLAVHPSDASKASKSTVKNSLARRCLIARRFLSSCNRGIMTAPSGGIDESLANKDRDKNEGLGALSCAVFDHGFGVIAVENKCKGQRVNQERVGSEDGTDMGQL
jgi:hypothetical protein